MTIPQASVLDRAADLLLPARHWVVLTGAGLSTDSGIPDYRGPGASARTPMTYQEFVSGPTARQRYWARSHLGWARMRKAEPNAGHQAVVALEHLGRLKHLITQNVDGLHRTAGSRSVTELHGRIDQVVCLTCRQVTSRAVLHERLSAANPGFGDTLQVQAAPDGDVDLDETAGFRVVGCTCCGGVLKPHVVFFGESVPRETVARCYSEVESTDLLLVAGSSLTVQSGLRFVRRARDRAVPVVIVNRGVTRGDGLAAVRLDGGCSETLTALADLIADAGR